jgi:phage gp36-like protein
MAQSQYADESQLISLSITQAAATRFGNTAVTAALQAASSIADSYINSVFVLPLQTSPQGWDMSLTLAVCNIAAYLLYNQVGFNPNAPQDQLIVKRYNDALTWLQAISDEKQTPNWIDSSGASPQSQAAGPFVVSDPPVGFTSRGATNATLFDGGWPWGWNN